MMNVIEVTGLSKIYNESELKVKAVDNVNISIKEGEFVALVGPSGSGKTTLLNMLGGLDMPSSGKIVIGGENITEKSFSQLIDFRLRNIGFVFQAYNLIPVLTAKENVEFVMTLQGSSKKERTQRSLDLLEKVGLTDKTNSRPNKLSGGQQQRIAVARALASKPKFILADEPTANLDLESTENLLNIMQQLNEKENVTFVFSTHDERVMRKAKRVIILRDGKIESDTSVTKL